MKSRMICAEIYALRGQYSVRKMCKAVGIFEAQYYTWLKNEAKREERREANDELTEKVKEVFVKNGERLGFRKLRDALAAEGVNISEYKLRGIMRDNGLYPVQYKCFEGKRKKEEE